RDLGGTYNPATHEELISHMSSELQPKPQCAALKYGWYMKTFGLPFSFFDAIDLFNGHFKRHRIEMTGMYNLGNNIFRRLERLSGGRVGKVLSMPFSAYTKHRLGVNRLS